MMSAEQGFQQDPITPNNGLLGGLLSRQTLGRVVGAALVALPGAAALAPAAARADGSLTASDFRVQVGPQLDDSGNIPVAVFNTGVDCETYSFEVTGDANTQTGNVQSGTQADLEFPATDEGANGTFNIADCDDSTTAITPFSFNMSFGTSFPNQVGEGGATTLAVAEGTAGDTSGDTSSSSTSSSSTTTSTSTTTTTTVSGGTEGGSKHRKPEDCRVPSVPKGGESWQQAASQVVAKHCKLGGIKFASVEGQQAVVIGFDAASSIPKHPRQTKLRPVRAGQVLAPNAKLFPIVRYVKG